MTYLQQDEKPDLKQKCVTAALTHAANCGYRGQYVLTCRLFGFDHCCCFLFYAYFMMHGPRFLTEQEQAQAGGARQGKALSL
jgi:hypothetical protein